MEYLAQCHHLPNPSSGEIKIMGLHDGCRAKAHLVMVPSYITCCHVTLAIGNKTHIKYYTLWITLQNGLKWKYFTKGHFEGRFQLEVKF